MEGYFAQPRYSGKDVVSASSDVIDSIDFSWKPHCLWGVDEACSEEKVGGSGRQEREGTGIGMQNKIVLKNIKGK